MSKLIPKSAAAIVSDLATAQVWPMLILAFVFVVFVDRLNRGWRGHWLKVHWNTPIMFNDRLMMKTITIYSSIVPSFYS